MKLWKAWFDIRQRFYLGMVLVTLLMAPQAVEIGLSSAQAAALAAASGANAEPETLQAALAYGHFLEGWIGGNAYSIFAIFGIVLAVGGILSHGNARSNLMTLSLPPKRGGWLTAQAAMATLLLLGLCVWEAVIMAFTGVFTGLDVPWGQLGLAILLTGLTASLWIWPALLCTAFTRESVRAALITVSVMVALQTIVGAAGLQEYWLRRLADVPGWGEAIPWGPMVLAAVLCGGSAAWALRRFRTMEF